MSISLPLPKAYFPKMDLIHQMPLVCLLLPLVGDQCAVSCGACSYHSPLLWPSQQADCRSLHQDGSLCIISKTKHHHKQINKDRLVESLYRQLGMFKLFWIALNQIHINIMLYENIFWVFIALISIDNHGKRNLK